MLAFAIDAAWADRGEQQRLDQLTSSLVADVLETQQAIRDRTVWAEDVVSGSRRILLGIADGATGPALDSLVFKIGNVFVKGRWAPINHTYEQALGSGDLALIEDPGLRLLLGRYSESLDNVGYVQSSVVTQYYGELEPYMVAHTAYAQVAWDTQAAGLVQGNFSTDAASLASQREFTNLLNLKLELELEMIHALVIVFDLSDELIAMLGES